MAIEPIITLAVDKTMLHAPIIEPSPGMLMAMDLFKALGIPFTTIDGQLLPGSVILFILAVWGAWHLILMGIESARALPGLYEKIRRLLNERDNS
jgi:hypothetical protein